MMMAILRPHLGPVPLALTQPLALNITPKLILTLALTFTATEDAAAHSGVPELIPRDKWMPDADADG